jgi:capsular exopolysaccharide synthesis family protein
MQRKKNNSGRIPITQEPYSPIAEDFRLLRANLELAFTKKDIHTILISSPQESEGKTTVAINLAACLSQTNKRVALLEADLRRPQLQTLLGIPHTGGVNSFITEQANIQDVASTLADIPNLLIVPAGRSYSDPTGLLGAERMRQLLKELKQLVDVVVIDSPPSFLADAQILASQADAVLLVVRPGITHAASAQSSIMMFERTGVCIAGVVMNCISHDMNHDRGRNKYLASLSD